MDPALLDALRSSSTRRREKASALDGKSEMEKYLISKNKKETYAVPLKEIQSLRTRSGAIKFYIRCGSYISKTQVKASRIDKELRLIQNVQSPQKNKIKGKADPSRREFGEISAMLDSLFVPFASNKKEFSFLALCERGGKYALMPMPSIGSAAKETLFSLSSMIDRIPRKQQKLRERILSLMKSIAIALDMDD